MIWTEFQKAIVTRLADDAYFTIAPAISVIAEENEDELTDTSLAALRKLVADALAASGVVVVVSEPDLEIEDAANSPGLYVVTTTIAIFENRTANKNATTGARRSAKNVAAVCHWLLNQFIPTLTQIIDGVEVPFEGFTPLKIRSNNYVGEEDGIKVRELVVESKVMIDAVYHVLGNDILNQILVTENNQPLMVSPTEP